MKKILTSILLSLPLYLIAQNNISISPSFDCSNQVKLSEVEKLICNDEELSRLDNEMAILYKKLLSITENKQESIQEQKDWIKYFRDKTYDTEYLQTILANRNEILSREILLLNTYHDALKEDGRWRKGQELWESQKYKEQHENYTAYNLHCYSIRDSGEGPSVWRDCLIRKYNMRINYINSGLHKKQKIDDSYLSYAEVLEDKELSFPKSTDKNFYSKVRPAGNFVLIGGKNNPMCKEVLEVFNEEGKCKLDFGYPKTANIKPEEDCRDQIYWYLNNSGFNEWTNIDVREDRFQSYKNDNIYALGLQYAELDIDMDGKNEHVYRQSGILSSAYTQKIRIFDNRQDELKNLSTHKSEDEWLSTKNYKNSLYNIINDKASWDILYPKDAIRLSRKVDFSHDNSFKYIYKIKNNTILIQVPQSFSGSTELLVFSLHKNEDIKLECILMPQEWQ